MIKESFVSTYEGQRYFNDYSHEWDFFSLLTFYSKSLFDLLSSRFLPFFRDLFSNAPTYQRIETIKNSVYCKFRKTCTI